MCRVSADNPSQIASASVAIKITDVNDNPPLLIYLEAYVCENAKPGQVPTSARSCELARDWQALCLIGHVC